MVSFWYDQLVSSTFALQLQTTLLSLAQNSTLSLGVVTYVHVSSCLNCAFVCFHTGSRLWLFKAASVPDIFCPGSEY